MTVRRILFCACLALACRPGAAQTAADVGAGTPDEVLAQTWAEALGGAEAVAWALGDVASDTTGAPAEALGEAGRARATAAVASAATAATLVPALQFSIALAGPAERASVVAALAEDALAQHTLMLLVAETVRPPPADPALSTAVPLTPDGSAQGVGSAPENWRARAVQIRAVAGRLAGAVAALGLGAP